MTDQQKRDLHLEAKELYNLYFAPDAMDRINFEEEVVKQFQDSKRFKGKPLKLCFLGEYKYSYFSII